METPPFKTGQAVVCLVNLVQRQPFENIPLKDKIYHIRDCFVLENIWVVRLVEIVNPVVAYANGTAECMFSAKFFKEIDESFAEEVLSNLIKQHNERTSEKEIVEVIV